MLSFLLAYTLSFMLAYGLSFILVYTLNFLLSCLGVWGGGGGIWAFPDFSYIT